MQIKCKEICDEIGHCNVQKYDYNLEEQEQEQELEELNYADQPLFRIQELYISNHRLKMGH